MSKRGFASMNKVRLRYISSLAGSRAHQLHRAHTFTSAEAKIAGAKGGRISKRGKKKKKP